MTISTQFLFQESESPPLLPTTSSTSSTLQSQTQQPAAFLTPLEYPSSTDSSSCSEDSSIDLESEVSSGWFGSSAGHVDPLDLEEFR